MSEKVDRFVALDVHKHYIVAGAVNAQKETVLHPRRVSISRFPEWAAKHLKPTDALVLEATTNAWYIHDLVEPLVARVSVAHPYHVKLIAAAAVKTDKRDTFTLAKLLAADMIPEIWVPPHHVRELRSLVAHRHLSWTDRYRAPPRLPTLRRQEPPPLSPSPPQHSPP